MDISSPKYLLLSYVAYLITYLVGSLFYGFYKEEKEDSTLERLFKKNVIGVWVCITLFSIYKTNFITINTGLLILGIYWIMDNKNSLKKQFSLTVNKVDFLIPFFFISLIYSLCFFTTYNIHDKQLYYFYLDLPVYVSFIERLCATNIESTSNTFYFKEPIRNLYHYGDLWISAFYATVLNIKPAIVLSLIYPSQLLTIFIIGGIAISQKVMQKINLTLFQFLIGFSIVFLSGISWYLNKDVPYFDSRWQEDYIAIVNVKYLLIGISLLWICLLIYDKSYKKISYPIAVSIPFYFVGAPALVMAYSIFLLLLILRKKISLSQAILFAMPFFIVLGYVGLYFMATKFCNNSYQISSKPAIQTFDITSFKFYKLIISTILDTSVRITISIFLYLVILIVLRKKIIKNESLSYLLFFLVTLIYSSVFIFGILCPFSFDSFQFWTSASTMAMPILALIIISILFTIQKKWSYMIIVFIVGSCLYSFVFKLKYFDKNIYKYNRSLVSKLVPLLKKEDNTSIVFLTPYQDSSVIWASDRNIYVPYDFMHFYIDNYNPVCLSVFDINFNRRNNNIRSLQYGSLYNSVFYKYVEKQKYNKKFLSLEQSQIDFIKEFDINYVIILPGAKVSDLLKSHITKAILDSTNQNQFCYLK